MKSLFAALTCLVATTPALAATLVNGAGATFPAPIYFKWASEYQKQNPDVQINYQSVGSGSGIKQFIEGTIDFGATDAPMSDEELSRAKSGAIHVPTVLGAVVVTYNLPDLKGDLKLDGETLAAIFLGTVTQWNDAKIAKLNPGVTLPDQAILVAHRSDGSGTSAVFTDYLSKASPDWKTKVGAGKAVNWPVGLGGKGNEGVAGLIKQSPGSLGYVELIYALENKLAYASLKNRAGKFVVPSAASVTAAASAELKKMPEDFRVSITDSAGKDAYPISSFTYLLLAKKMSAAKGKPLVEFVRWALKDGQKMAEAMNFSSIPKSMLPKIEAKLRAIQFE